MDLPAQTDPTCAVRGAAFSILVTAGLPAFTVSHRLDFIQLGLRQCIRPAHHDNGKQSK